MLASSIDWTNVLVALIAGLPAIIAAFYARGAHSSAKTVAQEVKTPSGDSIGVVAERTHDLAAVATLATAGAIRGGSDPPPVTATAALDHSVERLNASDESPVKVNGAAEGYHSEPPA